MPVPEIVVKQRYLIFAGIAVFILTTILYAPSMRAGFIWDDDTFVTENRFIRASDGLYRLWCTTEPPDYFPLTSSMLWIEWRLWGANAIGYHIVNVLLHAASAVLVWLVLRQLRIPGAWLAGLLFGIHPVNVESVVWITERKNTLPMLFYLATLLLYLQYESRKTNACYVAAMLTFLLALLSKTSVVPLPFVLLLLVWWQQGRLTSKDFMRTVPFFGLSLLFGLITWWFQYNRAIGPDIVRTDSLVARLAGAGCVVWFYLYKLLLPINLCFVYPRWQIDSDSPISYLPIAGLMACFALLYYSRKGWGRPLLAGFGYYVIMLLPVLGFLNIYFMRYSLVADHWQYFATPGAIATIVGITATIVSRYRKRLVSPGIVVAIAVITAFSMLSRQRVRALSDNEALWRDTLRKNPSCWVAHLNYGGLLLAQNKHQDAIQHFTAAIELCPDDTAAYYCRGMAYANMTDLTQAIRDYNKALDIEPDFADALVSRGVAYLQLGKTAQAIQDFNKAIQLKPQLVEAYNNRGNAYSMTGELQLAEEDYSKSIELDSGNAEVYFNRAMCRGNMKRHDLAILDFTQAITLKRDYTSAYHNRAIAFFLQNQYDNAWTDIKACKSLGGTIDAAFMADLIKASGRSQ